MTRPVRRVLLVGLGRHAERIYVPLLAALAARGEVELTGVIELASRREHVERVFFAQGQRAPTATLLDDARADDAAAIEALLRRLKAERPFDALLVSCDPRNRAAYFEFACASQTSVFVDKPVFALDHIAHDPSVADAFVEQLVKLEAAVRTAGIDFVVQTQRRAHAGYQFVRQLVDACVNDFGVPVTSAHVQHADGMWVLPSEWAREHHPYKYGFGKLFHSGYHFVDVLTFLLRSTLAPFGVTEVDAAVKATFPEDALGVWRGHRLLEPSRAQPGPQPLSSFGEHDVHALLDFRSPLRTVCVAELSLLQNSLSDRDPAKVVTDPYKGIGRVRHERVDLKLSSVLNVQVHSYQSRSTRGPAGGADALDFEVGGADHFEILLFRNPTFFRERAFEKVSLSALAPATAAAHNEQARGELFRAFLSRAPTGSELSDHLLPGVLTALLYRGISSSRGRLGVVRQALERSLIGAVRR